MAINWKQACCGLSCLYAEEKTASGKTLQIWNTGDEFRILIWGRDNKPIGPSHYEDAPVVTEQEVLSLLET